MNHPQIAEVIVDVPARATDFAFSYVIPPSLQGKIFPGMRVTVPFGPRTVQGFVWDVTETTSVSAHQLKSIKAVLDTQPIIPMTLLKLAQWMSKQYVCPLITVLMAFVPGALKTTSHVVYVLGDEQPPTADAPLLLLLDFVRSQQPVNSTTIKKTFPQGEMLLQHAIEKKYIVAEHALRDRVSIKRIKYVTPLLSSSAFLRERDAVAKRSPKQAHVLDVLAQQENVPWPMHELLAHAQTTYAVIKSLEAKQCVRIESLEVQRDPYAQTTFVKSVPHALTAAQQGALAPIQHAIAQGDATPLLLYGVTGSGKTEIYLQAIQTCLDAQREAILLIPEIGLTPQMVLAFKSRFGHAVAVIHSRLSQGEKYDEWRKILQKKVRIAIGARSAIFAPFTNVGLIVVDEEHESSYKQEDAPKYHARDVAIALAKIHRAPVVLGSATPSLESFALSHEKVYNRIDLPTRVNAQPLPLVTVVDMRQELHQGNRTMFSRALKEAMMQRLERKEQTILLLNRRGYASFVLCRACGYTPTCPHCDVSLTDHRVGGQLRCHYCGHTQPPLATCTLCGSAHIRHFGTGTQQVEEQLHKLFPQVRILRMDVDTTTEKGAHEKILHTFREQKADVLLGTQMVAKGLDFPHVTLVGVVSADTMLRIADFRSAEKTFQLLTQVAGRAGRHALTGEVIIQTYTPEHYSITYATHHDYIGFARKELLVRRELAYPPYQRLATITVTAEDVGHALRLSERFTEQFKKELEAHAFGNHTHVLGPVPSAIPKIKDRYRFQTLVKYTQHITLGPMLRQALESCRDEVRRHHIHVIFDIDPQMLL